MTAHEPRDPPLNHVPHATVAALRVALARCVSASADSGAANEVGELFRAARATAQREQVSSAQLVEVIVATWGELAEAAGIPAADRADRLASALSRCLEAVLN